MPFDTEPFTGKLSSLDPAKHPVHHDEKRPREDEVARIFLKHLKAAAKESGLDEATITVTGHVHPRTDKVPEERGGRDDGRADAVGFQVSGQVNGNTG